MDDINYKIFLKRELDFLEQEHLSLNVIIDNLDLLKTFSPFTIIQLKKRKLFLKDKIENIKKHLYPNIIA